ncbi:MAG: hypothetical protein IPN84_10695 [Sphingomonadales bacterium]|nr:hypothetical protein [Sphingomonadales bacterium]
MPKPSSEDTNTLVDLVTATLFGALPGLIGIGSALMIVYSTIDPNEANSKSLVDLINGNKKITDILYSIITIGWIYFYYLIMFMLERNIVKKNSKATPLIFLYLVPNLLLFGMNAFLSIYVKNYIGRTVTEKELSNLIACFILYAISVFAIDLYVSATRFAEANGAGNHLPTSRRTGL